MVEEMKRQEQLKVEELIQKQKELQTNLNNKEKDLVMVEEQQKNMQEEQAIKDKMVNETKVDKAEMEKLQDQLEKVREDIMRQKIENENKIK